MRKFEHIKITKTDLMTNIVIKRILTNKHLKYIGKYKIRDRVFSDEIRFDICTYHYNKLDIQYIDKFAKGIIVERLIKQINRK